MGDAVVPMLSLNADSRTFAWFDVLKQSAMPKVPLSVRLLTPDAEGSPAPASSASLTGCQPGMNEPAAGVWRIHSLRVRRPR